MLNTLKKYLQKGFNLIGYRIIKEADFDPVMAKDKKFIEIFNKCKNYSMTSKERMYALYNAVKYIIANNISGDFVECGVYKGGSTMLIAQTLLSLNVKNRKIYLYDTFEGMVEPSDLDFRVENENENTFKIWQGKQRKDHNKWCYASLSEVQTNMQSTNYPIDNLIYVKGKVEDTIPENVPNKISLLRLDTDWYASTKHELLFLYPLLSKNGVLIIDDYGYWAGSKKAVDEYFSKGEILFNRIDYTSRIAIKI
jgi:O-methyltransferase